MAAIYGHRWTTSYAAAPEREDGRISVEGDTWSRGLLGMAPAQIAVGIECCIAGGEPWPPTLPEFRAMCLGIPSLFDVRQELRPGSPTPSPFARAVWSRLDGWAYQRTEAHAAERMLREAYVATREAVMRGEPLPDEPVGYLDHAKSERRAPASPEAAREHPQDRGRQSAAHRGGEMNPKAVCSLEQLALLALHGTQFGGVGGGQTADDPRSEMLAALGYSRSGVAGDLALAIATGASNTWPKLRAALVPELTRGLMCDRVVGPWVKRSGRHAAISAVAMVAFNDLMGRTLTPRAAARAARMRQRLRIATRSLPEQPTTQQATIDERAAACGIPTRVFGRMYKAIAAHLDGLAHSAARGALAKRGRIKAVPDTHGPQLIAGQGMLLREL